MALPLTLFRRRLALTCSHFIHTCVIRTHCLAVVKVKPRKELASVMAEQQTIPKQSHEQAWPAEGLTRAPYRVFQAEADYRADQHRIFHGPSWNYLALEVDLPEPGDLRTTKIGDTPVIVTRDSD